MSHENHNKNNKDKPGIIIRNILYINIIVALHLFQASKGLDTMNNATPFL